MTGSTPLRIGTRGSPLALAQAHELKARLVAAHPALAEEGAIEVQAIRTSGDVSGERPLAELGGKGLFVKEIEEALLAERIDLAVHSMKDVPSMLPDGLAIIAVLPREDPRDVLIAPHAGSIGALRSGARVGTASPRRQAQLLMTRPDLEIVSLRGNVGTRIEKVRRGEADAALLALAGLKRLGATHQVAAVLDPDEMLPAAGQGAIGIEVRRGDERAAGYLAPVNHAESMTRLIAERALLFALEGDCRTPIAALAELQNGGRLRLRALIATPDGRAAHRADESAPAADAERLGREVGAALRARAGPFFFDGA